MRPEQASALRFLVSSAVAGMTPEMVSVIDASTGTLVAGNDESGNGASTSFFTEFGFGDIAELLEDLGQRIDDAGSSESDAAEE